MKKLMIAILIGAFTISVVGCTKKQQVNNSQDINNKVQNSTQASNANNQNTNTESEDDHDHEGKTEVNEKTINIYTVNDDNETIIKKEIEPNKEKSLEDEVKAVAQTLSKEIFKDLPIELMKIETIDGKKVATINLKEKQENYGKLDPTQFTSPNWMFERFQGSYGPMTMSKALLDSFLQKPYKGEWIDGVKFLYDGQTIPGEYGEKLSHVMYR